MKQLGKEETFSSIERVSSFRYLNCNFYTGMFLSGKLCCFRRVQQGDEEATIEVSRINHPLSDQLWRPLCKESQTEDLKLEDSRLVLAVEG